MREKDHSSTYEKDSLREDLEGRLASGGWQLEMRWQEEIPCEL
jgi:hypothetical protein